MKLLMLQNSLPEGKKVTPNASGGTDLVTGIRKTEERRHTVGTRAVL